MTSRWQAASGLNVPRFGHAMAVIDGGGMVVVGGVNAGKQLASAEYFHPATKQWEILSAEMEKPRWGPAVAVHNNTVCVFGGLSVGNEPTSSVEEYCLATKQWTMQSVTMSPARCGHTSTAYKGKLYIVGGASSGPLAMATSKLKSIAIYDNIFWLF